MNELEELRRLADDPDIRSWQGDLIRDLVDEVEAARKALASFQRAAEEWDRYAGEAKRIIEEAMRG